MLEKSDIYTRSKQKYSASLIWFRPCSVYFNIFKENSCDSMLIIPNPFTLTIPFIKFDDTWYNNF